MKNTKLIALVAVLVVITLVVSIVVATINDKKVSAEVQQAANDYKAQIDVLNKTIEDLNKGLINASEALEALKKAGVELENWNAASEVLTEKLTELAAAKDAFEASVVVTDNEDEEKVLVTFEDVYCYDCDGKCYCEVFTELYYKASTDLVRATSVEDMDAVIAKYTEDCEAVPTKLELLYTALETAEKDGVTYEDYDNLKLARHLLTTAINNENVYAKAENDEEKGEKQLLEDRLAALYVDIKPIVVDAFVALVQQLPTIEQLAPSHFDNLKGAADEYGFVLELYTPEEELALRTDEKGEDTAYGKALAKLNKLQTRKLDIDKIMTNADVVNEAIAAKKDFEILANHESRKMVEDLKDLISAWEETNGIVTDADSNNFNAELYNLVDRAQFNAYNETLLEKVAGLKLLADAYIEAIEAMEKITDNSKEALEAALGTWREFSAEAGLLNPEEVDYIVGYDPDKGVVAAWNKYSENLTVYKDIITTIETLENDIKAVMKVECKVEHGKDEDGNLVKCDCKVNVLDEELLANLDVADVDAKILKLLGKYGLDETVIDADLLTVYKYARLRDVVEAALANVEKAYTTATNENKDAIRASLKTLVKNAAQTAYALEAELVCTCPEGANTVCECNTYKLAEDAATKALNVFTVKYCEGYYAHVEK